MPKALTLIGAAHLILELYEEPPLKPGEVRAQAIASASATGPSSIFTAAARHSTAKGSTRTCDCLWTLRNRHHILAR